MTGAKGSSTELVVTLAMRLKGFAQPAALASATGFSEDVVLARLLQSQDSGHVGHRDGRIGGWHLTADGRQHLVALLDEERESIIDDASLESAYADFLSVNSDFKAFCTRWQQEAAETRDIASYSMGLGAIHDRLILAVDRASAVLPRFASYNARFAAARSRFDGGDEDALARPLSDSYHDVWMELHQDLLATLGRERTEADGH